MNDKAPEEEGTMTFWEHLAELRTRILKASLAFAVGAAAAWFYKERILEWVVMPLVEGWKQAGITDAPTIHSASPAEAFISYLKLALMGGFAVSMPFIFYQLWAFVAPGLYAKEKKFALPFVVASTLLFAGGATFGMKIAFPIAFGYLLDFNKDVAVIQFQPTMMVGEYIKFVGRMLLAFGIVFELPVVVFFLSVAGIVNHTHLIKFFRYFVVIAFTLGAVITPPDIMSQFLLAVPLLGLYVISIGIAWLLGRKPPEGDDPARKDESIEKKSDETKSDE